MPASLRTKRILHARRQSVRRQYDASVRAGGASAFAVETLARLHNVSRATIYKDLKATGKEARR